MTGIPLQLKSREVAFRVQVKKVSGQGVGIYFGHDVGWFNGARLFGIGRTVNHHYEDLNSGRASATFDDFFEMEFLAAGGNLAQPALVSGHLAAGSAGWPTLLIVLTT